jgi:hypothetical protein
MYAVGARIHTISMKGPKNAYNVPLMSTTKAIKKKIYKNA